jgi:uncharacterized protein YdhG (YjbR/CyaY superfamily)
MRPKFADIDEYIAAAAPEAQPVLQRIRSLIQSTVPGASETISYQMPAFKTDRVFVYFAAFKSHIGVYPPVKADPALEKALAPYRGEKGNLKFPLSARIPFDLIQRVVQQLAAQYAAH